jgi:hypothetical protein
MLLLLIWHLGLHNSRRMSGRLLAAVISAHMMFLLQPLAPQGHQRAWWHAIAYKQEVAGSSTALPTKIAKAALSCQSQRFATGSGYKGDDTCPVVRVFVAGEEFFQRFLRESSRFEQSVRQHLHRLHPVECPA